MDNELKHEQLVAQPTGEKLARLEDIWNAVMKECNSMNEHFQSIIPLRDDPEYKTETVEFMGNKYNISLYDPSMPPPKFKGVGMCPHCCRRAAMFARDMANALDDLVQHAEACQ